jgi:hypothetical protein
MCDAVQAESYEVDGIDVSNFLLPLYFTGDAEVGGRNDFLGRLYEGNALQSFGINPGGYVGFFNPETKQHETFSRKDDNVARKRLEIKGEAALTRRSMRYKYGTEAAIEVGAAAERKAVRTRSATARASRKRPSYELLDAARNRRD